MPKKSDATEPKPETLTAYSVIIDGEDRVIHAKDEKDRDAQIAAIRKQKATSPTVNE